MDQNIIETSLKTQNYNQLIKKTLQVLIPLSFISFLIFYYYSAANFHHNHPFSTLIFSIFAHRNYMFLICNAILAFLSKLMSSQNFNNKPISELPNESISVQENVAVLTSMDEYYAAAVDDDKNVEVAEVVKEIVLEHEEDHEEEEEEEEEEEVEESESVEVTSDARVSTEELNHKFEEFIRKMKEEIRVQAQRQLIAV